MPKELFQVKDFAKVVDYLRGPLKQIKTIESTESHTTLIYWIPGTSDNELRVCDTCHKKATFMYYDRDHMGRTTINLTCDNDARSNYFDWLNESESDISG